MIITMTQKDFRHICTTAMKWAESHSKSQWKMERFENYTEGTEVDQGPEKTWKFAYWVGEEYLPVILVKSFLAEQGYPCEVVWDMGRPAEWLILTDYDYGWKS